MRILLVRLDHVGDAVATVPVAAQWLRGAVPDARVEALVTGRTAPLLARHPALAAVHAFDAPWSVLVDDRFPVSRARYVARCAGFAAKVWTGRLGRFDAVVNLSMSPTERALCVPLARRRMALTPPRTAGRSGRAWGTTLYPLDPERHLADNAVDLLRAIVAGPADVPLPTLGVEPGGLERGRMARESLLGKGQWTSIHPGGRGSMKNWPLEHFAVAARELRARSGLPLLLVGGPVQAEALAEVRDRAAVEGVATYVAPDFSAFAGAVDGSACFIGNDGGPAHIAAALGVPTVVVFGPTDDRIFAPRGPRVRIVRAGTDCSPCAYPWSGVACPHSLKCLAELQPEVVLQAAMECTDHGHSRPL